MEEFSKPHTGRPVSDESRAIVRLWESLEIGKVHKEVFRSYKMARDTYNRALSLIRRKHIKGKVAQRLNVVEMRREG